MRGLFKGCQFNGWQMAMALVGRVLVLALKKKRWPRVRPKDYGCGTSGRRHIFIGGRFLGGGKNELQANFGLVDHSSEHMVEADSSAGRFKIFQVRE